MRREQRKSDKNLNTVVYISGGVLALAVIVVIITFIVYSNRLNSNSSGILDTQFLSSTDDGENILDNTAEASSKIGKSIEESKNETSNNQGLIEQQENEYTDIQNKTKQIVVAENNKLENNEESNNTKKEVNNNKENKKDSASTGRTRRA